LTKMATLTETAYYTRRTINWIIIGIFSYIFLRFLWGLSITLFLILFPPKPLPPTMAFGKLPALQFPKEASPSSALTFKLETIEGTIPEASTTGTVYFMPKKPANLLALTKTEEFAKRLGFVPEPIQETNNIYSFIDREFPRQLRYDIVTDNFLVHYAFERDIALFNDRRVPSVDAAIAQAKAFLQTYGLYTSDIAEGTTKTFLLRLSGNTLVEATSLSKADSIRVDFARRPIQGIPVVTSNPDKALISLLFSGSSNQKKRVLEFSYIFWPIDYETKATYPLKPSSIAWTELQSGKGYIARYPHRSDTAVVRSVYLAYYDSPEPQIYLQPIYVFEGDKGFMGYVPAIDPIWSENATDLH
ncbi:MAG: hypothetical protein Q7S76_01420, partial [bacterium]|nr:hypothetical protein [bacterium]